MDECSSVSYSSSFKTAASRVLNFPSSDVFSLVNLPNCDSAPQNDSDYEYTTDNDDDDHHDDDCNRYNVRRSYERKRFDNHWNDSSSSSLASSARGSRDSSKQGDYDDDDDEDDDDDYDKIIIEKIITSRNYTIDQWNELCQKLNTSEIMNGSLWHDQSLSKNNTGCTLDEDSTQLQIIQERFLVKWKDLSYLHCTWETREILLECTSNGIHQLNSFLKRRLDDEEAKRENGIWGPNVAQHHEGEDCMKSFMIIDRILDVSENDETSNNKVILYHNDPDYEDGVGRTFLIKWKHLPYSEATYEYERDLVLMNVEYDSHFDDYLRRHAKPSIRQIKENIAKHDRLVHHLRRLLGSSIKNNGSEVTNTMEGYAKEIEGQLYKNGGTLRDYQAEGVAWLVANYVHGRSSILADVSLST